MNAMTTNLALNCVKNKLTDIIEEEQIFAGRTLNTETANPPGPLDNNIYLLYKSCINIKYDIENNKSINMAQFNEYIARGDQDKLELALFYNTLFANTIPNTPNKFYFNPIKNAELSIYYDSDPVIISGLNPDIFTSISCIGGVIDVGNPSIIYSLGKYNKTSLSGIFDTSKIIKSNANGKIIIVVRGKSSNQYNTETNINVSVNNISSIYKIITKPILETTINYAPFKNFTIINAQLNTEYTSPPITLSGYIPESQVDISVENGTIDAGSVKLTGIFKTNTSVTSNLMGNIIVSVRGRSSSNRNNITKILVTINKLTSAFTILTKSTD